MHLLGFLLFLAGAASALAISLPRIYRYRRFGTRPYSPPLWPLMLMVVGGAMVYSF
jgi:hypothetical protein